MALRAIGALQSRFDAITLVHGGGALEVERIVRRCGIRLDPAKVTFVGVPLVRTLPLRFGGWALIKYALALRRAAGLADEYTVVLTTYGECTFRHAAAVQYIHFPLFFGDPEGLERLGARVVGGFALALRGRYVSLARWLAGWDAARVLSHAVLANSHWTAGQFCERYGKRDYEVIYPGATTLLRRESLPQFRSRANEVVILGRVVAGKRLETGIEIVRRLRDEHGHDLKLHIVGNVVRSFQRKLEGLLQSHSWVSWHSGMDRQEMEQFIAGRKWGLHCFRYEHYGIAPAELQMLGCIAFVPDEGGQREIVRQPELRYRDESDAVEKIHRVMSEPWRWDALLAGIEESNTLHDAGHFDQALVEYMQAFLVRGT